MGLSINCKSSSDKFYRKKCNLLNKLPDKINGLNFFHLLKKTWNIDFRSIIKKLIHFTESGSSYWQIYIQFKKKFNVSIKNPPTKKLFNFKKNKIKIFTFFKDDLKIIEPKDIQIDQTFGIYKFISNQTTSWCVYKAKLSENIPSRFDSSLTHLVDQKSLTKKTYIKTKWRPKV